MGAAVVRNVNHADNMQQELRDMLQTENVVLKEAIREECDCIIGIHRMKGRLVCNDAANVYGAYLQYMRG